MKTYEEVRAHLFQMKLSSDQKYNKAVTHKPVSPVEVGYAEGYYDAVNELLADFNKENTE